MVCMRLTMPAMYPPNSWENITRILVRGFSRWLKLERWCKMLGIPLFNGMSTCRTSCYLSFLNRCFFVLYCFSLISQWLERVYAWFWHDLRCFWELKWSFAKQCHNHIIYYILYIIYYRLYIIYYTLYVICYIIYYILYIIYCILYIMYYI